MSIPPALEHVLELLGLVSSLQEAQDGAGRKHRLLLPVSCHDRHWPREGGVQHQMTYLLVVAGSKKISPKLGGLSRTE